MKKPGRKPLIPGEQQTRRNVTFDGMTLRQLLVVGNGNLSRGIRLATKIAWDRYQSGAVMPQAK